MDNSAPIMSQGDYPWCFFVELPLGGSRLCELALWEVFTWVWAWWGTRFLWVWEPSGPNFIPFSQSLSTLALIEEFLGKRELPCLPGVEGPGIQKWVRNISYFREFIAALFLEPWHDLLKVFHSLSLFFSSTPFLPRSREVLRVSCCVGGTVLGVGELRQDRRDTEKRRPRPCLHLRHDSLRANTK